MNTRIRKSSMDRSSSHLAAWNELVTLSWCALGQTSSIDGVIDDATFLFFTAPHQPKPARLPKEPCDQQNQMLSHETETESMDIPTEASQTPSSHAHKRLEKLLPRPFATSPTDTTSTRVQISGSASMPHLSQVSLYQELSSRTSPQRWAIFTYLPSSSPPAPKEQFINSVVKAIQERLPVQASVYSCYDSACALHLPVTVADSDVVLFFVDSHLKSALSTLLESVPTFVQSSQQIEAPFSVLGSIQGRPLRALILHTTTHEDPAIKGALWQSLKALATLTPPE